jgi:hypothetical protein
MSSKVRVITIELDDDEPKEEKPPFKGGRPITLRLDEPDDIDAAQLEYLERILCQDMTGQTFRFRFRYDLHGTAHWHGQYFILDVLEGECILRLAGQEDFDASDGRTYKADQFNLREAISARKKHAQDLLDGKRFAKPRTYSLVLDVSWLTLTATDLKHALDLFKVAEVMIS